MLDVIVMDNRPYSAAYHERCVESVKVAIAQAGFPCRLVEAQGNLKAIAKARGAAFDQTTAPYVTWVVDFDSVTPDAFAVLRDSFASNPEAIYTRERRLLAAGRESLYPHRHHLAVYRRELVARLREKFDTERVDTVTQLLRDESTKGRVVDIEHWGYVRNLTPEVCAIYRAEIR